MLGHRGLGQTEQLGNLAGAQFLLAQSEQHPDAGRLRERFGDVHEIAHDCSYVSPTGEIYIRPARRTVNCLHCSLEFVAWALSQLEELLQNWRSQTSLI